MRQPSEEEIRALEAEMAKLTVDDVLLQTIVTLINLGARKAGLAEGAEPDWPQVKHAIDGARALMPIVEPRHGEALGPVKDALSRLQMAYVQVGGQQALELFVGEGHGSFRMRVTVKRGASLVSRPPPMPSMPSSSPPMKKPVTCSRPSSPGRLVLKKPLRIA